MKKQRVKAPQKVGHNIVPDRMRGQIKPSFLQGSRSRSNLVFSNPVGSFLSYRTVYDCYKRIVKNIGIPTVRVHELRHAYCALALENGDDIKTVQRNLGHATPDFTLKVYAYSSMDMQQNSADKMSRRMAALAGNQG